MIGLLWIAVFTLAVVVWLLALTVAVLKDDLIALHADVVKATETAQAASQVATATARWAFRGDPIGRNHMQCAKGSDCAVCGGAGATP